MIYFSDIIYQYFQIDKVSRRAPPIVNLCPSKINKYCINYQTKINPIFHPKIPHQMGVLFKKTSPLKTQR